MDLKYNPIIGIFFLVLGFGNFALAAIASQPTGIFMGLVFIALAGLMLVMKPVGITPTAIAMRNLLGMEMKRHVGTVELRKSKVYVGGKKRVSLWMYDADAASVHSYLDGQ